MEGGPQCHPRSDAVLPETQAPSLESDEGANDLVVIKRHWFLVGLILIFTATLADVSGLTAEAGRWCKQHHGTDITILLIFFFSGIILNPSQIKEGLTDIKGTLVALILINVIAPIISLIFTQIPLDRGIIIGLILVAAMPTTLSSGVVMTSAAGGMIAHALLITIVSNLLSVVTIPTILSILLDMAGNETQIAIDKISIMTKIFVLLVVPLLAGVLVRHLSHHWSNKTIHIFQITNQILILGIVWMGFSQSKAILVESTHYIPVIILVVTVFHSFLIGIAWAALLFFRIPVGRRESTLFMGIQKTLPLSVMLQVTLFPEYALALLVCVTHHFIMLMMDGFLVGRLRPSFAE